MNVINEDMLMKTMDIAQKKQKLYQDFYEILNIFLVLLQKDNNDYKHNDFHINEINEHIINIDPNQESNSNTKMYKCIVFMLMTIYHEKKNCRRHLKDEHAKKFENEIIEKSIELLKNGEITNHIVIKINKILSKRIDDMFFIAHDNMYGGNISVNYEIIEELGDYNIKKIYENINNVKRLLDFSEDKSPEFSKWKQEIHDIEEYLFCMHYYKPKFE